ncbi:hypothetical protein [Burkholderia cenocepacia]|uniref:Uncharacterized protein n=1 Tax=Burkholderia cenocepacia TaxID=95486 RepID=A0ABD4UCR9_9BURK|nr:hypothetical protein [Burkholderia cenocepacia]MCW3696368.1 hypothetical protein [Burkholderia cenocepacia]MCW3704413.1 hypothetical protein [Burkholderia cenocepacia]MCW3712148.1 hypothetical protein [Burkholderia cenocepacia]MCW3720147.1 hypothetical protein [Burkholderia cenocepacia]MCW3727789.1 hypothetical protein [Burkholderia cenocepacia]
MKKQAFSATFALLIFTGIYAFCELVYNFSLVNFLSSKNTEIAVFNYLETFGKSLSAIGISLFIIKLIPAKKIAVKMAIFFALGVGIFSVEGIVFDKIVHSLSPEAKIQAYVLGAYRNAALNEQLPTSIKDPVEIANIGLSNQVQGDIKAQVQSLFASSLNPDAMMPFFANYQTLSDKLDSIYALYAIQSKRYEGYKGMMKEKVDREFMRQAGVPPGLSKDAFMKAISAKSESLQKFQKTVLIPGSDKLGIKPVTGADLPIGMTQDQFRSFIQAKVDEVKHKTALSAQNVENLPYAYEIISSVYIPPLAIALSLLSIILNVGSLLFAIKKPLVLIVPALVALGFYSSDVNVKPYMKPILNVEHSLLTIGKPLVWTIHHIAINDTNPNEADIIRIKKPEPMDFTDLESKLKTLQAEVAKQAPETDGRITADENRLKNDSSYFGEIRSNQKINPYTGQSY